ncbi:MAG: Phage tail tape measure protein [Polaromonas sp.]|nr:Phage tail tape measure protein [Polaromonas sp.]
MLAGMQPSTAIDALKSAISNIIKPSEQAKDMAKSLGIEFDVNALKSKGLAGVLDDVAKATKGSADKTAILFGDVTGLSAVLSLTGPQADKFKTSIGSMGDSAGSVAEAYKKMAGSIDVSMQLVSNAFRGMLGEIGEPLLNEFGGISAAIAAVFTALGASIKQGGLKDLVGYIEGLMGDLQTTLETVAKNLPAALAKADFSGFKGGIDAVVQAVKTLFNNIDLSTVDGLTKAIELTGAAFLGLSKFTAGVIESFKPLFDQLVKVGSGLDTVDSGIFKTMGEMAGFATQANMLAGGLNAILPALDALVGLLIVKQGVGLAGALGVTATAASGLALAIGKAGLVGAAGAAGYAVGTQLVEPINDLTSKLTGSQTTLGGWIYDLTHGGDAAATMGAKTGDATTGVDKLTKAVDSTSEAAKDVTNPFEAANAAMLKAGQGAKSSSDEWGKSARFLELTDVAAKNAAASAQKLADATGTAGGSIKGVRTIIDEATGKIIGYEQAMGKGGIATKTVADETKKASDATQKWNEEIAKMNFQEKLKLIESQTKIVTAGIEADAKKTVAAFDSISSSIDSSNKLLGDLFGNFKDFGSMDWSAIRMIEKQIDIENKAKQNAYELQKKMTEATIAQMKAQTDMLLKGDGLITIQGDGLKPHLEAFMWEILQAIQVKVNKDGLKMLLGA